MSDPAAEIVVDASVALIWALAEEHADRAEALLTADVEQALLAPPLIWAEMANALYRRTRRGTNPITLAEAEEALTACLGLSIQTVEPEELYQQAFAFTHTHGIRAVYDALYVVLGQMLGVTVWTADQNLVNAIGTAAPWVRFIGDYPLSTT